MSIEFCIQLLTLNRVQDGLRLGQQNDWNQLEADWLRFLDMQPDGCFAAVKDDAVIGTACGCIFGSVAWIALVLVDTAHRKQGVGTALTRHVIEYLDAQKVDCIRLDATPLGRPIYQKLGFVAEAELVRYEGVLPASPAVNAVAPAEESDVAEICRFDSRVNQTDRRKFLERIFSENPTSMRIMRHSGRLAGYATARPGARAVQIGPCMAEAEAGEHLLADAFHRYAGSNVYIDTPVSQSTAIELAKSKGLTAQRRLLRMSRGRHVSEAVEMLWASSGPEKG